jgi:hypothetical protein
MVDTLSRRRMDRIAVGLVSGGLVALIWCGVWYAALVGGRSSPARWKTTACAGSAAAGLTASVTGAIYLRSRRLSLIDGSSLHVALSDESRQRLSRPHARRPVG